MAHKLARTLFFSTVALLTFGLFGGLLPTTPSVCNFVCAEPPPVRVERTVFLGGGLSDENTLVFTAAVAASEHPGVVLFDAGKFTDTTKAFLTAYRPDRVIPVGGFPDGIVDLERRLHINTSPAVTWKRGPPRELWRTLFPRAENVVVCPAQPRELLLQAACLAGVLKAPLFVSHGRAAEAGELASWVAEAHVRRVYALGSTSKICPELPDVHVARLANARAVAAFHLRQLAKQGTIHNLVIANPSDVKNGQENMSALAPWLAVQRRAALLLTNKAGDNVEAIVHAALECHELRHADTLILSAGLQSVPTRQRPNPIPGDKDPVIEMEPLTPTGTEPFSFAVGRLFHEDPSLVPLILARQRLLAEGPPPRRALVASNSGNSLPLLETFSRNTAKELRNVGYDTTTLFGHDVNKDDLRRLLPEHDLFLWEGHHNTLFKDWAMADWTEPLPPSFIFLQSCLALADYKVHPLLARGAIGIIGCSTRTYSASGGACSLAFFDALLYEDQSVGGALRQAKNFLLAYSLLKEKRLGQEAKRGGANLRAAWAFTLWGDPTLKLPHPQPSPGALPFVRHEVHGKTIVLTVPEKAHDKVVSARFKVQMPPNGRLAGLVSKDAHNGSHALTPFIFAEVHLPKAPPGQAPRLHSRLPSKQWVFCWDAYRRVGYLLALPRAKDQGELRFYVDWESTQTADKTELPATSGQ